MENKRKKFTETHLPQRGPKLLKVVNDPIDAVIADKLNSSSSEKTSNNDDETKLLQIDEHQALFSIKSPRHTRSVAVWESSKKQIELKKQVGKMFQYFGTQTKHNYTLLPEEAVFLLEMNYLELQWNMIPLSIQQAYALLLDENSTYCKLRYYRMYTQLLRDGYRIIRHKNDNQNSEIQMKDDDIREVEDSVTDDHSNENIKPLLDESVADVDEALKRLQIFNRNSLHNTSVNNFEILYDGFHPKRKFCKSNTSNPDICVCFANPGEPVPTVHHGSFNVNKSTKLLFGLEGAKNVVFYNVQHITVKDLNEL